MRLLTTLSVLFLSATIGATATSLLPPIYDPEILIDTGGDATDITTGGLSIILSPTGGGIFVFHNATGGPLSQLQLSVQFPMPTFPSGFAVDGTIAVQQPGSQQASFRSALFPDVTCSGQSSDSSSCVQMTFGLIPGPLIETGQNFVLDFDKKVNGVYTGVDAIVASGQYTGGTDTSDARVGDWPDDAQSTTVPVLATPEPVVALTLGTGLLFLGAMLRRKRTAR